MSIQVTFTTEQFEKNAASILAILNGGVASSTETSQKEETTTASNKSAGSKTTTRKTTAASKTAPKDEPKVSLQEAKDALIALQEAKDALIAVKDDENLGIAECRRIMKEAGVPEAKMANMAQEHAEKVLELAKLLLDGGSEEDGDGDL